MRCSPWLLPLALTCALVRPAKAAQPNWAPVTSAELAEDRPRLEPEAPAEVLSMRMEIDGIQDKTRNVMTQLRIKIYDPSRTQNITRSARFWVGPPNRFYQLNARLTLPDGTSRLFDDSDLRERSVLEAGRGLIGNDPSLRVSEKFLAVTGIVKGAVLDLWEWEPNTAHEEWMMHSIQRTDMPIREFEYVDRYRPDPRLLHRIFVMNPHGAHSTNDEKGGVIRLSAQNLPSIRHEPLAPPDSYFSLTIIHTEESLDSDLHPLHELKVRRPESVPLSLGPWAYFSTAQDYHDADQSYSSGRANDKARELVAGAADDREKARRIYAYVQGLFQRFHRRADLENWYTRSIESIDELINLDKVDSTIIRPQDFHYLFISLLRAAGLECHSVFHADRSVFRFRPAMASERFLNYFSVGVKVGQEWVLCNPCEVVPLSFGTIPWQYEGFPALLAMPRQEAFLTVPPLAAEKSTTEIQADLTLDANGEMAGECVRTFLGHSAYEARRKLKGIGEESWTGLTHSLLDLDPASCEAHLTRVEGLDDPESPLRIHAAVRWPAQAPLFKDRIVFPLSLWHNGRPPLLSETERTTPVFFHYPEQESETVRVRLPPGVRPSFAPKPIVSRSGDFSYALAATFDPASGVLKAERSFTNRATEIAVADYPKARDWFLRVGAADQVGIVLKPSSP